MTCRQIVRTPPPTFPRRDSAGHEMHGPQLLRNVAVDARARSCNPSWIDSSAIDAIWRGLKRYHDLYDTFMFRVSRFWCGGSCYLSKSEWKNGDEVGWKGDSSVQTPISTSPAGAHLPTFTQPLFHHETLTLPTCSCSCRISSCFDAESRPGRQ